MVEKEKKMIWTDSIYYDDKEAWFIDGQNNILFKSVVDSNYYKIVSKLPGKTIGCRINPICIKYHDYIVCLPDNDNCIKTYNIISNLWTTLEIEENPTQKHLGIRYAWIWNNKLVAFSWCNQTIYKIDIGLNVIERKYKLYNFQNDTLRVQAEKIKNSIYFLSATKSIIYEFDLSKEEFFSHELPINEKICSFATNGCSFWIGSLKKKIYYWNKITKCLEIIDDFPKNFGIYNFSGNKKSILDYSENEQELPIFLSVCSVQDEIWFIPFQANEILYMNKSERKLQCFEMINEVEDVNSLKRPWKEKYIVEYIRDDRFIVLYSRKNECLYEIDTIKKSVFLKQLSIDKASIENIDWRTILYFESVFLDRSIYSYLIQNNDAKGVIEVKRKTKSIGMSIYEKVKNYNV